MKTKLLKLPPMLLLVLFAVFLIKSPDIAAKCVTQSLKLSAAKLIPALFPFFVLSSTLRGLGIARTLSRYLNKPFTLLFGVSGSGALPLILGFTGGYPVGVMTVCDMHAGGEISKATARRLLLFCGNTGPAFILGAAGAGLFASFRLGFVLYIVHILSAILIGIFCRFILGNVEDNNSAPMPTKEGFAKIFTDAVSASAFSCLNVTSYVVLFSLFAGVCNVFGITDIFCLAASKLSLDPIHAKAVFTGFLELGSGIDSLYPFARNLSFALPACAFFLGWGGISVHCQAMSFITREGLSARFYILSKFAHGLVSALLVSLWLDLGGHKSVFSFIGHDTVKDYLFDYLGLFFSVACALAALFLHILRSIKHRKRKG